LKRSNETTSPLIIKHSLRTKLDQQHYYSTLHPIVTRGHTYATVGFAFVQSIRSVRGHTCVCVCVCVCMLLITTYRPLLHRVFSYPVVIRARIGRTRVWLHPTTTNIYICIYMYTRACVYNTTTTTTYLFCTYMSIDRI